MAIIIIVRLTFSCSIFQAYKEGHHQSLASDAHRELLQHHNKYSDTTENVYIQEQIILDTILHKTHISVLQIHI